MPFLPTTFGLRELMRRYAKKTADRADKRIHPKPRRYGLTPLGRMRNELDYQTYRISEDEHQRYMNLADGKMTVGDNRGRARKQWI